MRGFKKKISKNEFIKHYLKYISIKVKCEFCKYNFENYQSMPVEFARILRNNKCVNCKHLPVNIEVMKKGNKKHRHFLDNFKPLYEWENQENNE
jgi:hypothetical protein